MSNVKYLFIFSITILQTFFVLPFFTALHAETLYGVVSNGENSGYLISVNTVTGAATPIGNTGMSGPSGLTYNTLTGDLLAINAFGGGQVRRVDTATGAATVLAAASNLPTPGALAYRAADNMLYTNQPGISTNVIKRLNASTGASVDLIGVVNKGPMGGMAVRPSDGVIFGAGSCGVGAGDCLFTISTIAGPPPRESDVGTTGRMITALSFHPTSGVLYGSDGSNLVTINPATATVTTIGPFGAEVGFVAGLSFVPDTGDSVDVWIKDCAADVGNVPSHPAPCPQYYTSPDIWIDNNNDMVMDAPVVGADNILHAVVRNRGTNVATNVTASFYYRDNTTGLVFPDGATLIGTDTVTVVGGSGAIASITWPNLPAPPTTGGHWCIGVVLNHANDGAITPVVPPYADNNVGIANIWFIAGRAGEAVALDFNVGTGGKSGFGLTPWPREFRLEVVNSLPEGWRWALAGVEAEQPFSLNLGEERAVKLSVTVAADAMPHVGGSISVRQVDVVTGTVLGGVKYDLYEDSKPPQAVGNARVSLLDGKALLSWNPVLFEADTNLPERVAYYEVLRDGEPLVKVLRDEDPEKSGMQWTDPEVLTKTTRYAVRVVDEGGNISIPSPEMVVEITAVDVPEPPLFNWLTWLLLVLLVVLLVLAIKRKSEP